MGRFYFGRNAIMGRMPKKKLKKQSDQAQLSQVKKEMAQPRAAESTRSKALREGDPQILPRSIEEKAMRNRWLAFLIMMVAAIAVFLAHGEWGGAYAERHKTRLFETNARDTLRTISTAVAAYSTEHGRFPVTLADMGPAGDKLLNGPMSSGAILGYAIDYRSSDSGRSYAVMADPRTRFGRNFFTDQTRVLRIGRDVRGPECK
jgi:hypothetical protein